MCHYANTERVRNVEFWSERRMGRKVLWWKCLVLKPLLLLYITVVLKEGCLCNKKFPHIIGVAVAQNDKHIMPLQPLQQELDNLREAAAMFEQEAVRREQKKLPFAAIMYEATKKGIGGGIPGATAGVVQVITLMWIRTVINYQYRYGTSIQQAVCTLMKQGGVRRFYRGIGFALVQNPLAKFGSTAANDGIYFLVSSFELTKKWGPGRTTVLASFVVAIWRMFLMPIDTCKTVLQVDSEEGFRRLVRKVRSGKVGLLYQGAVANAISSIFSYYPWFYTYNLLRRNVLLERAIQLPLLRNGVIGFLASVVSDTVSNFMRVIKTTKQAVSTKHACSYHEAISMILAADGLKVRYSSKKI